MHVVGVISDTHGLLRPEIPKIFKNVDLILHAGDIGSSEILQALSKIAPTISVRGNNDTGEWAKRVPEMKEVQVEDVSILVLHDRKELPDNRRRRVQVVVTGHSHRPSIEHTDGILFLNPGSAGPRRFSLPISVARLKIDGSRASARLVQIRI
jgi:putative phosphoesterase